MKEFMTQHADLISKGLRTEELAQGTSISQCVNLISEQGLGLYPFIPPVPPLDRDVLSGVTEWNFPYPVISYGDLFLLFNRDAIFMIDDENLYELPLYDVDDGTTAVSLTSGRPWSIAQMQKGFIATNGMNIVLLSNQGKMIGGSNKVLVSTNIRASCVLATRSRILMGGFDSENCWSNTWKTYWTGDVTEIDTEMGMEPNFVWWSCIGGGDLLLELTSRFMAAGYISGASDTDYIRSIMRQNNRGFIALNHPGMVRQLLSYGKNNVIAYTDTGVSLLVPYSSDYASGFGEFPVTSLDQYPGIMTSGAAAGNEMIHLTMDRFGALWLLYNNELKRLGYSEFFKDWVQGDVSISFDGKLFYICNGYRCYVYNIKGGLTEINQLVTSVAKIDNVIYGIVTDPLDMDRSAMVELDGIGIDSASLKFLTGIQVAGQHDNTGVAMISYKHEGDDDFSESNDYIIGPNGYCKPMESGISLKAKLTFDEFSEVHIKNLITHLQYDAQHIRGIYVS